MANSVKVSAIKAKNGYFNCDVTIKTFKAPHSAKYYDTKEPNGDEARYFVQKWNGSGYENVEATEDSLYDIVARLGITGIDRGSAEKLFKAWASGNTSSLNDIELNAFYDIKINRVIFEHKDKVLV